MSNYVEQLEGLKEKAQKNKEEKIRLEQQLKSLEENKSKLVEELVPLGVGQDVLATTIQSITQEIEKELAELTGLING